LKEIPAFHSFDCSPFFLGTEGFFHAWLHAICMVAKVGSGGMNAKDSPACTTTMFHLRERQNLSWSSTHTQKVRENFQNHKTDSIYIQRFFKGGSIFSAVTVNLTKLRECVNNKN
jgi:hypothetical protein